jgi:hypothetical protein
MKQSISVLDLSLVAAVAIVSNTFVAQGGVVATAASNALGVADTNAAIGQAVKVAVLGTAVVLAGGAIAAGVAVEVGADGTAVTKAAGVTVGRALNAAAAGDFVEVLLIPN